MKQLWYNDSTSKLLAEEVLAIAQPNGKVACIGCPSVYQAVWKMKPSSICVLLLDNVKQFEHYKENYVFYDYNQPLDLPQEMERAFDIVVVDPPFLTEECLCKTALTTRYIAKDKILLCTG
uniref:N(6)-adenine-specific DNA methyltransferase 2 n=1 Tax=Capitella teleta TaxID=283909 RepID=X2BCL1_CAPTE